MKNMFLLNEVATALEIKPYKITYALTNGLVEEPEMRIAGKRIFSPADVRRLKNHFSDRKRREKGGANGS